MRICLSRRPLDALFTPETLDRRTDSEMESRWQAEAAYGLPALGGRFTGGPHVASASRRLRATTPSAGLTPAGRAPDVSFGVMATRRESDTTAPEHILGVEATARW